MDKEIQPHSWKTVLKKLNFNWYFWSIFAILVLCGVTGSSLGWFKSYPGSAGIAGFEGERKLVGMYRGVRGDEFIAHGTPNAIAQYLHEPQFPLINMNQGIGGRNFLVYHDLGVPVWHVNTLARPATWGFFLFDLRRGLSWYWLLPVFLCIWSIHFFMNQCWPGQQTVNLLLSIAIVLSPSSAGWSFWPANNAMGICLSGAAFLRLAHSRKWYAKLGWGMLCGWGASIAVMSLYPPRVLTILTLVGLIVLARMTQRRSWKVLWRWDSLAALGTGLFAGGVIIFRGYADAAAEVRTIMGSVYPGLRNLCGGDMFWWELMKGWLAPLSMYRFGYMNQSEVQGVLSLIFPFAVYIGMYFRRLRDNLTLYAISAFCIFTLIYQHVGIPEWLGELTLWRYCYPNRADMSLTMAQFFLIGMVYHEGKKDGIGAVECTWVRIFMVLVLCLSAMALVLGSGAGTIMPALRLYYPNLYIAAGMTGIVLLYAGAVVLMFRNFRWFLLYFACLNIALGAVFNPVCIAPNRIVNKLLPELRGDEGLRYGGRVMFATGNDYLAMIHFLSGGRIFNGYFCYEDDNIFHLLYEKLENPHLYHRMNHMSVFICDPESPLIRGEIPYNDRIDLFINGIRYRFDELPIDYLAAPADKGTWLRRNPSLQYRMARDGVDYYRVLH